MHLKYINCLLYTESSSFKRSRVETTFITVQNFLVLNPVQIVNFSLILIYRKHKLCFQTMPQLTKFVKENLYLLSSQSFITLYVIK